MDDDFQRSETSEHHVSTLPDASNGENVSSRKNRSEVWNYYTMHPNKQAECVYCANLINASYGTTSLKNHLNRCKDNPNTTGKKRKLDSSSAVEGHVSSCPLCARFDQEFCRKQLVKMIIATELPFRFVEHEAFREFVCSLQPKFDVPSRTTVARDILLLWDTERTNLKKFLQKHCGKVCLTTDTWTSCQNLCYMCLTAHFIDQNWMLHKKILNFCKVQNHSGETMAKMVVSCLNAWGLDHVFSLTVDNASSNDTGIEYLKRGLRLKDTLVLNGDYIHTRCCAHILNLIVKDGLKEVDDSILRIRAAVKYIKSSPSRQAKFKVCIEKQKIESNCLVSLDVETRWNSTYLMLDSALKHQKAFDLLELEDKKYVFELKRGKGVPKIADWNYARTILPFLKIFYEVTLRISGTSYATSNIYMIEVFKIGKKIRQMCELNDESISAMAKKMKLKYDKYWGNANNWNMLLLIAVVLDPRCKMDILTLLSDDDHLDCGELANLKKKLDSCLNLLFEAYNDGQEGSQRNSQGAQLDDDDDDDDDIYGVLFRKRKVSKSNGKSELDVYLEEALENPSPNFDILTWWKVQSSRFPIIANIAREVLAIPVSTVASESAFSTGGRVLDPYRSCLTPQTVESLICTQDWLKGTPFEMRSTDGLEEELQKVEHGTMMLSLSPDGIDGT